MLYVLHAFFKGVANPLIMACCAVTLIPFQMSIPAIGVIKINEVAIILWVIIFVLYSIRQKVLYTNHFCNVFIAYLILMLFNTIISYCIVANTETITEYVRLFITIVFPLSIVMLFGTEMTGYIDDIFESWNKGATIVSTVSLIYIPLAGYSYIEYFRQYFSAKTLYFYELKFASSPCIADPNSYAGYLAISLMITICLYKKYNNKKYLASLILELTGLIFSLSRGTLFALVIVGAIYFIVNKRTRWIGILFIPVGIAIAIFYFVPYVMNDGSASSRFGLWATALSMYGHHPLFGVGLQNYTYMFNSFRASTVTIDTPFTHNLFLKVLVETGALGEAYFLYMCISAINTELSLRTKDRACFAFALGTITFMIQGLSVEFFTSYFFWFMLVLGSVYSYMKKDDQYDDVKEYGKYENIYSDSHI